MNTRRFFPLILVGMILPASGCAMFQTATEATRQSLRVFKPRSSDYRDLTEEADDEWEFVGKEARGDRLRETDPDPWWQKYIMSEKARSIERNLGID